MIRRSSRQLGMLKSIKEGVRHTVHGFNHFTKDVGAAVRLSAHSLNGYDLTRHERRHIRRTVGDVFRMVPFSFFLIVPFMELLLPVFVYIFPKMLPSQFQSSSQESTLKKKRIAAKVSAAKLLSDTLAERVFEFQKEALGEDLKKSANDVLKFVQKMKAGEPTTLTDKEMGRFQVFFTQQMTLNKLTRDQLAQLCNFFDMSTMGPDAMLRARLRQKLKELRKEDRELASDGVHNLTMQDLIHACKERGIRVDLHEKQQNWPELRLQLSNWLYWSLKRDMPATLLFMAQCFSMQQIAQVTTVVETAVERDAKADMERERDAEEAEEEREEMRMERQEKLEKEKATLHNPLDQPVSSFGEEVSVKSAPSPSTEVGEEEEKEDLQGKLKEELEELQEDFVSSHPEFEVMLAQLRGKNKKVAVQMESKLQKLLEECAEAIDDVEGEEESTAKTTQGEEEPSLLSQVSEAVTGPAPTPAAPARTPQQPEGSPLAGAARGEEAGEAGGRSESGKGADMVNR